MCGQHLKHLLLEKVKIQTGLVQEYSFWNRLKCFPAKKSPKNAPNSVDLGPGYEIYILALQKLLSEYSSNLPQPFGSQPGTARAGSQTRPGSHLTALYSIGVGAPEQVS